MEIINFFIMFGVAVFASAFGTLIGGASIITIPTLILLGLPPHTAIGTDRFGIIGVGVAGWYEFHKKGLINYRVGFIVAIPILFGSALGANIVLQISEAVLKNVIVVTTIILTAFLLLNSGMGVEQRETAINKKEYVIGAVLSFVVGIYGGFYGAMAGTFSMYILIAWFRQTFIQSAATQKIGSICMTVTAATIFALHGAVDYKLGLTMLSGCLVGSYLGAHYAERIGNVWVKRMFILFIVVALTKIIFS
ncbi:MAG: sulfite exporter TauE/SafE family protein [Desulfocapsaceae bacterium]